MLGVPITYSGYPQHPGREMGTAPQGCAAERLFFANHWCASDHAPPVFLPRAKTTTRYQPVHRLDHVIFRTDQSHCRYRPHSATCSNRTPWRRQARGSTLYHRSRSARRCDVLLQPQALSCVRGEGGDNCMMVVCKIVLVSYRMARCDSSLTSSGGL